MDATANLSLPFILPSQAQKHVTHNESLLLLDSIVQLAVFDRDRAEAPEDAAEGDRYIVAEGAGGAWHGHDGKIAALQDGAWLFLEPRPGWQAWVCDERILVVWDGVSWIVSGTPDVSELQNLRLLGVGTEADSQNVFAAKLNKALWTARGAGEGGDGSLRYTMNKEAAADVLSLLMQSGWSGRAELGLVGSDDLSLKVSADGSVWREALAADRATGIVSQPALPRFKAFTNYDNYVGAEVWTKIGINDAEYNDQGCFDAATGRFTAPAAGTYLLGASLLYKVNASVAGRMSGRLVRNGAVEIRGSFAEFSSQHESLRTALQISTLAPLSAGDTVELQGYFRQADGYFAANHTTFWGMKVG
jgi:hypothetical protein